MKNITDFEDLLKDKYGEKGTPERDRYEADSLAFRLGDIQILTFHKLIETGLGKYLNISIG